MRGSALPMFTQMDGNDRNRDLAARNAAPVLGSYICNDPARDCGAGCSHGSNPADRHCWHESTSRRLEWQGGSSTAAAADLAAWNRLGAS